MNDNSDSAAPTPDRVECRASKDSAVRLWIGTVALIGFGLYCVYDGYFHMVPDKQNPEVMAPKYPAPEVWDGEHINQAITYSLNHFGPYLFIPVGIMFGLLAMRAMRRTLLADGDGLSINGKAKIPWSEFTGIDASRFDAKGLLTLKRSKGESVTLDKYHYAGFRDVVAFIEDRVGVEG